MQFAALVENHDFSISAGNAIYSEKTRFHGYGGKHDFSVSAENTNLWF